MPPTPIQSSHPVPIIETVGLSKRFGGVQAVRDVSMSVQAETLHSIIGPNGAGKTTLFNLISGNLRPSAGRVLYRGQDITNQPVHRTIHLGIGRSFQITNIFPNLTVLENVRLAAQAVGRDNLRIWRSHRDFPAYEERAREVLAQVGLSGAEATLAKALPHGDKRKLELGILLAPDPDVLLLDEPTAGMATEQVPRLIEVINRIRRSGKKTILLVEHRMDLVMNVSDRITVMHQGAVLAEGAPQEIASNQRVQQAYLGELYEDFEMR